MTIDQARIDAFADATEDRQFIHVDPEAAAQTAVRRDDRPRLPDAVVAVAHGGRGDAHARQRRRWRSITASTDVRFLAPVRSGKRIRGRFTLDSVDEKAPGQFLMRHRVTVEIEGEDKPALTALWLGLMFI